MVIRQMIWYDIVLILMCHWNVDLYLMFHCSLEQEWSLMTWLYCGKKSWHTSKALLWITLWKMLSSFFPVAWERTYGSEQVELQSTLLYRVHVRLESMLYANPFPTTSLQSENHRSHVYKSPWVSACHCAANHFVGSMKASHLLSFVLTLLLQLCCCWCSADQRTLGGNDEARRLPQLLKAQPLQGGLHDVGDLVSVTFTIFGCSLTELLAGLNVTVKERGENKEHLDEGTSISHSGKGSGAGKGGGKGAGGGSQTLRQPRDQRNSSASSWRWPRSSLTLLVGGLLLLFLHSCGWSRTRRWWRWCWWECLLSCRHVMSFNSSCRNKSYD